jgi:hypothetical protein
MSAAAESNSSPAVAYCRQLKFTTELQWFVILQLHAQNIDKHAAEGASHDT